MFATTQKGGSNLALTDVCLTPSPSGPVPVAYPNQADPATAIGFVPHVMMGGAPAHNLGAVIPQTMGDEAGSATGLASGTVMGPSRCTTAANTVIVGGLPLTRMSSVTLQNSTNAPGSTIAPSQTKVLVLAP